MYSHLSAYKLGRWDGNIRFRDIGGRTYLNLLDRILPTIEEQDYEIDIEDNREYMNLNLSKLMKVCTLKKHGVPTFQAGQPNCIKRF